MRTITTTRKDAIERAHRAADRLAAVPSQAATVADLVAIVKDTPADWEAWDGVVALEWMVTEHGLITAEQVEAERAVQAQSARAEADAIRAAIFGTKGEKR